MPDHKQKLARLQTANFFDSDGCASVTPAKDPEKTNCTVELTRQLQSRNDVADLMQTYSNTIQRLAPHNHLRFEHKAMDIDIQIGNSGIHKCTYNLYFSHYSLGRITLSRNERFTEEELSGLENTLCILFYPLDEMIHHGE